MAPRPKRSRADAAIVSAGLAADVSEAAALVMAGRVLATDGKGRERKIEKAGEPVAAGTSFRLKGAPRPYVSRGGLKLAAALDAFQVDPSGLVCADLGLSTGGFTDCLLQRGAARVFGVDVAYGQVDLRVRDDPRVVLHERTNARHLPPDAFGERVQLIVIDVSFISLTRILEAANNQLAPGGAIVALVKPQFECEREALDGGIVRDPDVRTAALDRVLAAARAVGLEATGTIESPIHGADGNVEYLVRLEARAEEAEST